MSFYRHFTLPMDRSHGFGSMAANSTPSSDSLSLRLRSFYSLTLLTTITRWPVLQKVRGHRSCLLPLIVSTRFQILFHSPSGVLFTFPSRYLFTIGHMVVFSLRGWSLYIPTEFHVFDGTLLSCLVLSFVYRTFTFYG